eukprot:158640-Prymnesium_polylepis.1
MMTLRASGACRSMNERAHRDDAASECSVLFADDDVAHPCDGLAPAQCCAHCGATNLRLLRCARCLRNLLRRNDLVVSQLRRGLGSWGSSRH